MTVKFYETQAENWREWGDADAVSKLFKSDIIPDEIAEILSDYNSWGYSRDLPREIRESAPAERAERERTLAAQLIAGAALDVAFSQTCAEFGWDDNDTAIRKIWADAVEAVALPTVQRIVAEAK